MSDQSGLGFVELTALQLLGDMTGGGTKRPTRSAKLINRIEQQIGLGEKYGYELVLDMARPWILPTPLIEVIGNRGYREDPPADPEYTSCRLSRAGEVALKAESGQMAPVPLGLINGTSRYGGMQPALEPWRVIAALRFLAEDSRAPDEEILQIVGYPYSPAHCDVSGDFDSLFQGRKVTLTETGRTAIAGSKPNVGNACHSQHNGSSVLIAIESLPAETRVGSVTARIESRARASQSSAREPSLSRFAELPISDVAIESFAENVRILVTLRSGSDPEFVRNQLTRLDGVAIQYPAGFPKPLARLMRTWVIRNRVQDISSSLDELEAALELDRNSER